MEMKAVKEENAEEDDDDVPGIDTNYYPWSKQSFFLCKNSLQFFISGFDLAWGTYSSSSVILCV